MNRTYRHILKDIYDERKNKNPAYSLVAFSRDAGYKSYHMNDVLKGRYGLSPQSAVRVADYLKMPPYLREEFIALVTSEEAKSPIERARAKEKIETLKYRAEKVVFDSDIDLLSNWYYLAILELAQRADFTGDPVNISERLGIRAQDAAETLKKLTESDILIWQDGQYRVDHEMIAIHTKKENTSSAAIQSFHSQMISKGVETMKTVDVSQRLFTSFNVNLTHEEYLNLTIEVSAFIRKKISLIHKKKIDSSKLYTINMQAFPLEKV